MALAWIETVPAQIFWAPTRALRSVRVELIARDHLDAVNLPIDLLVLVAHGAPRLDPILLDIGG